MGEFPGVLLNQAIARAQQTPFYSSRLRPVQNVEEWEQIPLTTKADLRAAHPFGMRASNVKIATYHESSGTSGTPVSSFFSETDWEDVQTRFLRSRMNLTDRDTVLVKTPYSLVTTALQMHGAARRAGATVIAADNRSAMMTYSRVIRLLKDLKVTVTWSMPTEAMIWAYLIRRLGMDPARDFPNLRALVVAGESLSREKKAALSQVWGGKDVVEDYGSTETGSLAGECRLGQLHLWDDRLFFEVCEGSLVVTPFYREAMPLIRYNMEDQVRIHHDCECGQENPAIEVLGRKGQKPSPKQLEAEVYACGGTVWFWRARTRENGLELEIHGQDVPAAMLEEQITAKFGQPTRVRMVEDLEFVPAQWLSEEPVMQKPKYVFSEREDWHAAYQNASR